MQRITVTISFKITENPRKAYSDGNILAKDLAENIEEDVMKYLRIWCHGLNLQDFNIHGEAKVIQPESGG